MILFSLEIGRSAMIRAHRQQNKTGMKKARAWSDDEEKLAYVGHRRFESWEWEAGIQVGGSIKLDKCYKNFRAVRRKSRDIRAELSV
jgi:hypothetical protein